MQLLGPGLGPGTAGPAPAAGQQTADTIKKQQQQQLLPHAVRIPAALSVSGRRRPSSHLPSPESSFAASSAGTTGTTGHASPGGRVGAGADAAGGRGAHGFSPSPTQANSSKFETFSSAGSPARSRLRAAQGGGGGGDGGVGSGGGGGDTTAGLHLWAPSCADIFAENQVLSQVGAANTTALDMFSTTTEENGGTEVDGAPSAGSGVGEGGDSSHAAMLRKQALFQSVQQTVHEFSRTRKQIIREVISGPT